MAYIRSAHQAQFQPGLQKPGAAVYHHPADSRKGFIPLAFQITSPYDWTKCLLPHALISHVNPRTFSETHTQKVERFETMGGWVEQHWPEELSEISADSSTGAFLNLNTGLSSVERNRTIAMDRFQDLQDLYHNNGALYSPEGEIVLQGKVMLMFDRGTYIGEFTQFSVDETADNPYSFSFSWTFKVDRTILSIPISIQGLSSRIPSIQRENVTGTQT